jgi:dipeptidyl aminopeptidase/acylaminoacyl peptidase
LSAGDLVAGARGFIEPTAHGDALYFLESRPDEGGRQALMRRLPDGAFEELGHRKLNVRSRVHEYGGGALAVGAGAVYFTDFADQSLHRLVVGRDPVELSAGAGRRFADCIEDVARERLICVLEDHTRGGEPSNSLVAVSTAGPSAPRTLFALSDFVAAPALSADGTRLAFVSWDHPNMPWDDVQLRVATLDEHGNATAVALVNGGQHESVLAPQWGPDGKLYFISDRDDFWNFYRVENGTARQLTRARYELGRPMWNLGQRLYGFLRDGRIVALSNDSGREGVVLIAPETGEITPLAHELVATSAITVAGDSAYVVGALADHPGGLFALDVDTGALTLLRESQPSRLPRELVSLAEPVSFPTNGGETAHGFYYPPLNPAFRAPDGELPPLIVLVHGGPTAHVNPALRLPVQFWTTRGFAVFDLNYRGSTGFGRAYRRSLYPHWGSKDVEDAVRGARNLADTGRADPKRLLIRGGSAGGFTVLAAHAFHDVFAAGANHYGVSDMEALAQETHKFESRYLDQLVGPYPAAREKYRALSPIRHLDGFRRPLITFQGLEDKVVPPAQSAAIVAALKAKGVPVAYVPFAGEQHGFRDAKNIVRAYEAELSFYGQVLGFAPADAVEPVEIFNLR